MQTDNQEKYDAVIVGAGFGGLEQLYTLRSKGYKVRCIEKAPEVGGTWYWNRYPGARCDVESMQYSFSFLDELQQEWRWSEKYSPQPEILSYAKWVADKLDLRKDIDFNTKVTEARFNADTNNWTIATDTKRTLVAHYLIMATGCLSVTNEPVFKGRETFKGTVLQTSKWPHEKIDFSGKKVAIIGTGSTSMQMLPVIAKEAASVTVFQRTPNFAVPCRNGEMTDEYDKEWKKDYGNRRAFALMLPFGITSPFINNVPALSVSEEERQKVYEEYWGRGNLAFVYAFNDIATNLDANKTAAEFFAKKVKETVKDPKTADLLIPKDYPMGGKRICVQTDYYETFNRENVQLVDLKTTPIEEFCPTGIRTTKGQYDVDYIIFATGFDGITGALTNIDIYMTNGKTIRENWKVGPSTYFGLMAHGLPNFFMITGPGSPSVLSNMFVPIHHDVTWITNCMEYLKKNNSVRIEPTEAAEKEWMEHVRLIAGFTVFSRADSWYMGANIPGKARTMIPYAGGIPMYSQKVAEATANNYAGFSVTKL